MGFLEKRNLRAYNAGYGPCAMTCAFKLPDLALPNHPSLSKEGSFMNYLNSLQLTVAAGRQLLSRSDYYNFWLVASAFWLLTNAFQ